MAVAVWTATAVLLFRVYHRRIKLQVFLMQAIV